MKFNFYHYSAHYTISLRSSYQHCYLFILFRYINCLLTPFSPSTLPCILFFYHHFLIDIINFYGNTSILLLTFSDWIGHTSREIQLMALIYCDIVYICQYGKLTFSETKIPLSFYLPNCILGVHHQPTPYYFLTYSVLNFHRRSRLILRIEFIIYLTWCTTSSETKWVAQVIASRNGQLFKVAHYMERYIGNHISPFKRHHFLSTYKTTFQNSILYKSQTLWLSIQVEQINNSPQLSPGRNCLTYVHQDLANFHATLDYRNENGHSSPFWRHNLIDTNSIIN